MRLIELAPIELAAFDGFRESVDQLRKEAELPLFASARSSYDVEQYTQLHRAGLLMCAAVVDKDGALCAWGVLMKLPVPRRDAVMYTTDVMWSSSAVAGAVLLRAFLREAGGSLITVTASVGGRLDRALSNSAIGTKTHNVYTLDPRH